ncbi:MAG: hypothetical protein HKP30_13615, partial [Myxococcales bacterium]|nr:hypothetical protein [Myxococcales bacterium]
TNPLRDPTDAAFAPDGSLWVTGGASDNLFRVAPDGTVVQVLDASGSGGVAFEDPQELAVGPDGDVLVATETALLRIFPDGTVQHLFDGSQPRVVWGEPKGIGFDALGNAYGIGVGRTAYRFAPDGTQTILIDWRGDGTNPLKDPSDLAVLPDGTVFVSGEGGDDVFRIEPGGSISRITDARMAGPIDMAFGPDGTLYIACRASWNVMGLTPTGDVFERADFGSSLQPQQIAIDGDGDVYVGTGSLGGRIAWVRPFGALVTVVDVSDGGLGLSAAGLTHLTVDDAGDVYVPGLLANALFRVDVPPECSDGIDNDQDGLVDHPDDPGCRDPDWWEDPACDDDVDNDGDGRVDWDGGALGFPPDPTCNGAWEPTERSGCGLGGELALLLPILARLRRRIRP